MLPQIWWSTDAHERWRISQTAHWKYFHFTSYVGRKQYAKPGASSHLQGSERTFKICSNVLDLRCKELYEFYKINKNLCVATLSCKLGCSFYVKCTVSNNLIIASQSKLNLVLCFKWDFDLTVLFNVLSRYAYLFII